MSWSLINSLTILFLAFFSLSLSEANAWPWNNKEKPILIITDKNPKGEFGYDEKIINYEVFKKNQRIYFLIYNPKGFESNFIKYQIDFKKNSYPNYVFYDKNMQLVVPNQETRLGYCYGDLGIIAMYLKAYKTFEDKYFFNIAKQMLEKIANRIIYENISNDYFCHGISSVFYFVNQFNGLISSLNEHLFDSLKKDLYNRLISVDFNLRSGGILTGYHGIFLSLLSPTRSVALEKILLLK